MKTRVMTAKTVDEAIEIALKELGVDRGEVEVDVVSRGKEGILGIGSEPAKVRVTVLDTPNDLVTVSTDIINSLISKMGVSVSVSLKQAENESVGGPVYDIDGDDSGLLIGRRGETLRALQFLVSFMASRKLESRANLLLDVAGYQSRRYESLSNLATKVAGRVFATGRSIHMEPMPPNERRAVHMALADHPEVSTISEGERESRHVVVQLSDQGENS